MTSDNDSTKPEAPRAIPLDTTEADLHAFLRAKAASYDVPDMWLTIRDWSVLFGDKTPRVTADTKDASATAFSFDEAVAELKKKLNPTVRIAALRAKAAAALAEAEKLEGSK